MLLHDRGAAGFGLILEASVWLYERQSRGELFGQVAVKRRVEVYLDAPINECAGRAQKDCHREHKAGYESDA